MGLIRAARGAIGGTLADQWKEFFYADAIGTDVLVVKGQQRQDPRSANRRGNDNIISSGSVIAVADGQAMAIVDNGEVVEFTAEPGEFVFDESTEPSIFNGSLGQSVLDSFKTMGRRFTFGGGTGREQRVYYFNLKEITGNKYGTPSPIPFRAVDTNIGLDIDISIRCHGKYSYRLIDPLLFYRNVSGNVAQAYRVADLDAQLKSELLTALQPAFAQISAQGVRISALPGHTTEIAAALNGILSEKWGRLRGLEIATFNIKSVTPTPEDAEMIRDLQRKAVMRDPGMAGATMVGAQADAMRAAGANPGGAMMGFLGMNAAMNAGGANAGQFFDMAQQQGQPQLGGAPGMPAGGAPAAGWTCQCGSVNGGKFCAQCGTPQPALAAAWTCQCGQSNTGKFCPQCGTPHPAPAADWACQCGQTNTGRFCANCGTPKP
ncbi:MAG: SPFH domain-containing protein [Promicromonosporaceae bacterium]|nr:SPFH domain-containing protein [Promicromonosporaceae bacterium]